MVVRVDGRDVPVTNEKGSLTSLGQDELLDDRISKMTVLSRSESAICPFEASMSCPV
jgi:hypothetical protein